MPRPIYGWTSKQWVRVLFVSVLFSGIWISLRHILDDKNEAILATTALILLWYTVETWGLRWQMVRQNEIALRQNEISIQPLVLATVESRQIRQDQSGLWVVLRNIGRGPALFVHLDEFGIEEIKEERTKLFSRIPPVDCIEPGKDRDLPVEAVIEAEEREFYRDPGTGRWNFAAMLHPQSARETYHITIRYEDTDRRAYWAKVQMGKGGIRLLDHGQEAKGYSK